MSDNINFNLFTTSSKMSDLVLRNYTLLPLFERFGIRLGFGDKRILEVCSGYNVDSDFFTLVCNVYTFDNYLPESSQVRAINIDSLLNYLKSSHAYYRDQRIASIGRRLAAMVSESDSVHNSVVVRFFEEYSKEVARHFEYEESVVFPYIRQLIFDGKEQGDFHIDQYEENHSNIDDKLSDLKNIVIKYLPESWSCENRKELLYEIFSFEQDLIRHTRIEEKILIPFVEQIEKKGVSL